MQRPAGRSPFSRRADTLPKADRQTRGTAPRYEAEIFPVEVVLPAAVIREHHGHGKRQGAARRRRERLSAALGQGRGYLGGVLR